PKPFRADLLNPVSGLLQDESLLLDLDVDDKLALKEFVDRLQVGLAVEAQ
ncbi:MAG: hypothetical protein GY778_10990, partial [bacterium]|nr:hypothetical protein [bacterium]